MTAALTTLPGLHPARLVRLMADAVAACRLDLSGSVVYTEAATGPYVVTPVLAAMAGADEVIARTRSTRYGSADAVMAQTLALAERVGVTGSLRIVSERRADDVGRADIVTNSGHVRPIDAEMVGWMKPSAVVPLMFEAWELSDERGDLDLGALRARGIAVAGTNERNPAVDVFSFLGVMAMKLLLDAGVAVRSTRVVVLCDNAFGTCVVDGLRRAGAEVVAAPLLDEIWEVPQPDALVVALQPRAGPVLGAQEAGLLAGRWPGTVVAQVWGDLDRAALADAGVPVVPATEPAAGHMGVLPSAIGPEPVVRLQAGGLKVGEVLLRPEDRRSAFDRGFVDDL